MGTKIKQTSDLSLAHCSLYEQSLDWLRNPARTIQGSLSGQDCPAQTSDPNPIFEQEVSGLSYFRLSLPRGKFLNFTFRMFRGVSLLLGGLKVTHACM